MNFFKKILTLKRLLLWGPGLILLALGATLEFYEFRKAVAVVDTGVVPRLLSNPKALCKYGHIGKDPLQARHLHGTNMANIILENMDTNKYCLLSVKISDFGYFSNNEVNKAFYEMLDNDNIAFANMSFGGNSYRPTHLEYLDALLRKGVHLSVAAGNDNIKLSKEKCFTYPACSRPWVIDKEKFDVVGSYTNFQSGRVYTNYGAEIINIWENGELGPKHGTSMACARHTGKLAR